MAGSKPDRIEHPGPREAAHSGRAPPPQVERRVERETDHTTICATKLRIKQSLSRRRARSTSAQNGQPLSSRSRPRCGARTMRQEEGYTSTNLASTTAHRGRAEENADDARAPTSSWSSTQRHLATIGCTGRHTKVKLVGLRAGARLRRVGVQPHECSQIDLPGAYDSALHRGAPLPVIRMFL